MSAELRERLQAALGDTHSVERELGGGGMSRVFLATEIAFGRKVVAKILHPALAEGVSIERFKREIALVAKLQHPHIVPLLNAGERDGLLYYTMPLVEGDSLRQRLERQIELPIAEAARVLRDIASALAYAHRHGVVHRDIKPENVLFSDGVAVVTDFGIAKAITVAKTHGDAEDVALTELGTSLGTPAYMAPEQVTADPNIDHRADLYALGCVAFEVLAGRPPFVGRNTQLLMSSHATEAPEEITKLRPTTPPPLAALVMQCLAKRPADRPQGADDIVRALETVVITPVGTASHALPSPLRGRRTWLTALIAATLLALGIAIGTAVGRVGSEGDRVPAVQRWSILLPDSAPLAFVGSAPFKQGRPALAISADGALLVYVALVKGRTMLYTRALSEFESRPLSGTEGAYLPFFSPDGKWIAFFAGRELKKIGVSGSGLLTLAQVVEPVSAVWLADGRILVAEDPGQIVYSIREEGGGRTPVEGAQIVGAIRQSVLGAEWVLATWARRLVASNLTSREVLAFTADGLAPVEQTSVEASLYGSAPFFVGSGHIVYTATGEDGAIMALPFDVARRRLLGGPQPVLRGVRQESGQDSPAQLAVSDNGTLVYAPGQNAELEQLVIRDRSGRVDSLPFPLADYGALRVSPDGNHAMVIVWPPSRPSVLHLIDLRRGTRVVATPTLWTSQSAWWPDSRSVVLAGRRSDGSLFGARVSIRNGELIDTIWQRGRVTGVSSDSARLLVSSGDPFDIWLAWRDTTRGGPVKIAEAPAHFGTFSPDGNWISYTGSSMGRFEVIVVNARNPAERYQISPGGGEEAVWSESGDEIVYRDGHRWRRVRVSTRNGFTYQTPELLFEGPYGNVPGWSHGMLPDRRHVLLQSTTEETTTRLNVVTNWFSELRRQVPPRR